MWKLLVILSLLTAVAQSKRRLQCIDPEPSEFKCPDGYEFAAMIQYNDSCPTKLAHDWSFRKPLICRGNQLLIKGVCGLCVQDGDPPTILENGPEILCEIDCLANGTHKCLCNP